MTFSTAPADIAAARAVFGPSVELYIPVVKQSIHRASDVEYLFLDHAIFESMVTAADRNVAVLNGILAEETLLAAHLCAVTSIIRGARWMEATWRQFEAKNFLGFAACCRSLLEAAGDTAFSLGSISLSLAEQQDSIKSLLAGRSDAIANFGELESVLIHYGHGRKLAKSEKQVAPAEHAARSTTEYIAFLERMGVTEAAQLYADLCQIGHPAKASLDFLYSPVKNGGFMVDPSADSRAIEALLTRYGKSLSHLPSVTFNPGLLILKALHRFSGFPKIPELRDFTFQGAPAARKVSAAMRR